MLRVAFQGDRGAYGEEAIRSLWGGRAEPLPVRTFAEVVRMVACGEADAGVLPVENSLVGEVRESVDALHAGPRLSVLGVTTVLVRHCLLGVPGATLAEVRRVESHPVALAQCRGFLARHAAIAVHEAFDTAGAARDVAHRGDRARAAIAGRAAATRYGLAILADGIADADDNRTRFVAVGRVEEA